VCLRHARLRGKKARIGRSVGAAFPISFVLERAKKRERIGLQAHCADGGSHCADGGSMQPSARLQQ
jgi:hypothetical protein